MIGVQVETCAPFPASLAAGEPVGGRLGADDRRRDRGQAPGRADAGADQRVGRRASWSSARTTSPRRWCSCSSGPSSSSRAPARSASPRCSPAALPAPRGGHDRRRPVRRQRRRRAAGADRPPPREPGRPPAGAAGARARTARGRWRVLLTLVGRAAAPTCSTSSTSARASTCTSARRRCSWCWRRAGPSTPSRSRGGRAGGLRRAARATAEPAWPDRRVRCARPRPPLGPARRDHAGCARRPPDATGRRARSAVRAPRSPRGGRRAPRPVTSGPRRAVDALVVVGLRDVQLLAGGARRPASRAASRTSWSAPSKLPGLRR